MDKRRVVGAERGATQRDGKSGSVGLRFKWFGQRFS
jgi:hypothetical protein